MSIREAIARIRLIGKEKVAQFGQIALIETTFSIESAHKTDDNVAHISYQPLLPTYSSAEFVPIREASRASNQSARKIQKLCRRGLIRCKKNGRNWSVDLQSLSSYLSSH